MPLQIQRAIFFLEEFELQTNWYAQRAGEEVAYRWFAAVESTLFMLASQPEAGRQRKFPHKELAGLRSFRVIQPFNVFLIFYHATEDTLFAERLIHGARDLPRRLRQPPGED
jgi:toxin ParE1/3/4